MSTDPAAQIHNVRFTPVRLREGYDMGEVDYLLDRLERAVTQGEPLDPILDGVQLNEVRVREGYDIAEVDAFLAALRIGAGPAPEKPADEPAEDRAEEAPGTASAPAPVESVAPAVPAVIVAQRGLLARLFGRRGR